MTSAALPPSSVTVRVPAKVNLELLVGAPRDDGYHPLSTIFPARMMEMRSQACSTSEMSR